MKAAYPDRYPVKPKAKVLYPVLNGIEEPAASVRRRCTYPTRALCVHNAWQVPLPRDGHLHQVHYWVCSLPLTARAQAVAIVCAPGCERDR
ncbi:hypothetical protein PYCCODRAFT_1437549 [Trametes coccinea BRFM310]|uniref:Uncharacterized protein n=1 Tax=Trametes coccinea (strain BRFM310) TaxID=1353009 RepID=A0A1Y2IJV6_TRAC3|nr:hypothetical protein PYCCODRAFT_1437549 [Trametes coccinea BRFM310]